MAGKDCLVLVLFKDLFLLNVLACTYVCVPLELGVAVISHVDAGNQTWSPVRPASAFNL